MASASAADMLSPETYFLVREIVRTLAQRSRMSDADGDDFESWFWSRLIGRDLHVLRCFGQRCSLRTYLTVVAKRSLLDFRASRWGKWRPSAAARDRGAKAIALERLVCRDGIPLQVAETRLGLVPGAHSMPPTRPGRVYRTLDDAASLPAPASAFPDAPLLARERQQRAEIVQRALRAALTSLSASERELLRLRYAAGLSVADIATRVSMDSKHAYRRYDKILGRLRRHMERASITAESVRSVSGDRDICIDGLLSGPASSESGSTTATGDRAPTAGRRTGHASVLARVRQQHRTQPLHTSAPFAAIARLSIADADQLPAMG